MHFMNPVLVMKLVEVIQGLATSDEVYKTIETLLFTLGVGIVVVQFFGIVIA